MIQVEYAMEAVKKGSAAVAVRGKDIIVLAIEKKSTAKLQEPHTIRKIAVLDRHICLAFAGLTADGRVLVDWTRVECQNYRLSMEDAPTVEYITRFVATTQQRYTQSGGVRPFGISCIIIGFDPDGTSRLFCTEPSGAFLAWKAVATGRSSDTIREYLEKNYADEGDEQTLKLAVKGLLEVVEAGSKNCEVAVLRRGQEMTILSDAEVEAIVADIQKEAASNVKPPKQ